MNSNNNTKPRGLIGKLYFDILDRSYFRHKKADHPDYTSPGDYFQKVWLGITVTNPVYFSYLNKYDTFVTDYNNDVRNFILDTKRFEEQLDREFECYSKEVEFDRDNFIKELINALENTHQYKVKRDSADKKCPFKTYDLEAKHRLIYFYQNNSTGYSLSQCLRLYIYFAQNSALPNDLYESNSIKKDIAEFSECVTKKYGMSSKHGIRAIYALATRGLDGSSEERPNSIALYEYADLLYYGNAIGIKQDINKAFKYYKIAAAIEDYNETININYPSNPLALWSLSYIYLEYHKPNSPLENCDIIPEIENLSVLDRVRRSYLRAKEAYNISKLPAAANIIGKIAMLNDNYCKGIEKFKETEKIENCVKYFEEAAKGGYIYANNNLANIELIQAFESDNSDEFYMHINSYISYLEKSSEAFDPWAANKLGRIFLNGIQGKNKKTNEAVYVTNIIDKEKSFKHFMNAYKIYHIFYDVNCAWACAHILKYFNDRITCDEKNDMQEIIKSYNINEINNLAYN